MNKQLSSNIRAFVAGALDHVQNKVAKAESVEELMQELVRQLPFGNSLSIVYQEYGSSQARTLFSANEFLSAKTGQRHWLTQHSWVKAAIQTTGLGKGVQIPSSELIANDESFSAYKNVAVVPMRLSEGKNIGAFVLHSHGETFDKEDIKSLDKLADRMAFFVQNNLRRRRNKTLSRFTNDALGKRYNSETELLQDVLRYLGYWFEEGSIYLLIRDPFHIGKYFLANDGKTITKTYRSKQIEDPQLAQIAFNGTMLSEHLKSSTGIQLQRDGDKNQFTGEYLPRGDVNLAPLTIDANHIKSDCHSWLGATMHLNDKRSLGHIILHNITPNAYQFEDDEFLDSMADFTALLLGKFREQEKYNMIAALNDFRFGAPAGHTPNDLYTLSYKQLQNLYGINTLQISVFNRGTMLLEPVFQRGDFPDIPEQKKQEHARFVLDQGKSSRKGLDKRLTEELIITLEDGGTYLVVPMRISRQASEQATHLAIGCFMLPAKSVGYYTAQTIDDLSDVLAEKINFHSKNERQEKIIWHNHQVANLDVDNLTQDSILELAHQFVAESMFSENFYFALHDKAKNRISFPLIFKDSHSWAVDNRTIDPNALGKTEAIIYTKKPILHYSRAESEAWYSLEGHAEHGGDPLASWIGVPVFLDGEVIGVIATYHPTLDWVYTQQDLFFLESVAAQISGLFRAFRLSESKKNNSELKELNHQLEKAQIKIAEQQHIMSTALLAQDLTHRLNNSIGSVSINIEQAIQDIRYAQDVRDLSHFKFTTEALEDVNMMLKTLIKEISSISSNDQQSININDIIKKVCKQVSISHKLENYNSEVELELTKDNPLITSHYRTLFNTIFAIVENSAQSIISDYNKKAKQGYKIHIKSLITNDNIIIKITDNGLPIPSSIKAKLFQYGVSSKRSSGFGLWRAKTVLEAMNGSIELDENHSEKTFTISIPFQRNSQKTVFILDDEKSWLNILNRWLTDRGFKTHLASSRSEMTDLLNKNITPYYVFLDISLDSTDGANYEGLSLINTIKKRHPSTKIIIISGYAEAAKPYQTEVENILQKIDDNGNILSKEKLLNLIN